MLTNTKTHMIYMVTSYMVTWSQNHTVIEILSLDTSMPNNIASKTIDYDLWLYYNYSDYNL